MRSAFVKVPVFSPQIAAGKLGIELIAKPNFLFLDEPTSPLDPETTENMMLLFRRLADEGRIVVMVTHKFEKFNSMHNIVLLTKGLAGTFLRNVTV